MILHFTYKKLGKEDGFLKFISGWVGGTHPLCINHTSLFMYIYMCVCVLLFWFLPTLILLLCLIMVLCLILIQPDSILNWIRLSDVFERSLASKVLSNQNQFYICKPKLKIPFKIQEPHNIGAYCYCWY
jgi:hypothetical protein